MYIYIYIIYIYIYIYTYTHTCTYTHMYILYRKTPLATASHSTWEAYQRCILPDAAELTCWTWDCVIQSRWLFEHFDVCHIW